LAVVAILLVVAIGAAVDWRGTWSAGGQARSTRDQVVERVPARVETAMFGAGCFWGVEAAFRKLPGVVATSVGFAGGFADSPTYRQVSLGATGHAEVVRVSFDPAVTSYDALLEAFWSCHDPTRPREADERAGGEPSRSIVFYANDAQRYGAKASRDRQAAKRGRPVVTEIRPATTFWRAEEYHQQYLEKNGPACPPR
jgi:peptide-methionine (S)-S-oxide reductase